MKRCLHLAGEALSFLALTLAVVLMLLLALAMRIVYETVMLPVRVWRAERDGSESWPVV